MAREQTGDEGIFEASPEPPRNADARLGGAIEHTLRAPLSRAATVARALADQVHETQAPAVRSIVDALEHAESMLLDVAEFLRDDVDCCPYASRRRTNLSRLCERVLDSIQCRYPAQALKFEADRRVDGHWDPDALASLISRVVLNAIEHGPRASVRLRVWGLDDRAVIEVWNAGAFPPEVPSHRLFEPFACATPRASGGVRGLGLGLHLASRIARSHGGRIEIQSDASKGTTLRVVLPRA